MKLLNTFNKSLHNLNLGAFLHNRYLLYILCILSIVNIVLLGNKRDYNSIIIFVVVAFLTSFFNKNMIVILSASLLTVYALNYKKSYKEGLTAAEKEGLTDEQIEAAEAAEAAAAAAAATGGTTVTEDTEDVDNAPITPTSTPENKDLGTTERTALYNNLTKDFQAFQKVQTDLLATMKEIDPLLAKAESFVNKFEGYKDQAAKLKKKQK